MLVGDDGIAMSQVVRLINQKSAWFSSTKLLCCKDPASPWFSSTKLLCCKDPASPCPKNTFAQLKWMVDLSLSKLFKGKNETWTSGTF